MQNNSKKIKSSIVLLIVSLTNLIILEKESFEMLKMLLNIRKPFFLSKFYKQAQIFNTVSSLRAIEVVGKTWKSKRKNSGLVENI